MRETPAPRGREDRLPSTPGPAPSPGGEHLLDAVPVPLLLLDEGLRVRVANRAFRAAFPGPGKPGGLSVEDVLRAEGLRERALQVLATGASREEQVVEVPGPSGPRFLRVAVSPSGPFGGGGRLLLALEDVTEQVRLVSTVREVRERMERGHSFLAAVLDNMEDGVVACDPRGNPVFLNRAARELLGVVAGASAGWDFPLFAPGGATPIPGPDTPLQRALRGETVEDQEVTARPPGGKPRTLLASARRFAGPSGEAFGAIAVLRDITEEQLRQAQKMEAIGSLAGGVAHDFNNLLTAMLGYSGSVLQRLPADSPIRREVEQIEKAAERGAGLTRQLLAFSRRQVVAQEFVDLGEVVRGMVPMLRRLLGEDVVLVTTAGPEPARVHGDRGKLEQVVMNLVVNARDAMPRGGTITILTAAAALDEEFARTRPGVAPGPHVLLAVADTGVGMDAETRSHLFEPFFTTKGPEKGTGLGLATVYGIVKQGGGHIELESEPGRGTTFQVWFPRADGAGREGARAGTAGERQDAATPPPRGTETVLLVEDERMVRALVGEVLRSAGYAVLEARDGEDALEVAARPGALDLLLSDVVMPRLNGPAMAGRLRASRGGLRVLFMSGYTDRHRVNVESPGTGFLQKPFTPGDILRKVREVLDGPPPAAGADPSEPQRPSHS